MILLGSGEPDFRNLLRREFDRRCRELPRYSLRAFARDLNLSPSRVSEILRGKQGLSREAAGDVAVALGWNARDAEVFCDLVESQHGRAKLKRELASKRVERHRVEAALHVVEPDIATVVAEWYHLPILQLTELQGFRPDARWIAQALGIKRAEAQRALDRLERVGLLMRKDGKLIPIDRFAETRDQVPIPKLHEAFRTLMQKAGRALETQKLDEREVTVNYITIDPALLPEAKRWLRNFRRRFSRRMDRAPNKDRLYCLNIQFFNLTEGLRESAPGLARAPAARTPKIH